MYHDKFGFKIAEPVHLADEHAPAPIPALMALLAVAALPVLGIGLLLNLAWRDVKLLGRGLRVCVRTYAEEFARR